MRYHFRSFSSHSGDHHWHYFAVNRSS